MKFSYCFKCRNENYIVKNAKLSTIDNEKNIFSVYKQELFYLKICTNCGYTEIYDAKLVDEYVEKKPKGI